MLEKLVFYDSLLLFCFSVIIHQSFIATTLVSAQTNTLPGDANQDLRVDGLDYVIWLNNYGITNATGPSQGDFNSDSRVDGLDYVVWLNNYGNTITPTPTSISASTPTPSPTRTPTPTFTPTSSPVSADFTISPSGSGFTARNNQTGATFTNASAWSTIQYAIDSLTSGTVHLSAGTYPFGKDTVVAKDPQWTRVNTAVTINNSATGIEGPATRIDIPYPAPTGLIACYTFPASVSMSDVMAMGFWFKPSIDLSSRAIGSNAGSPIKIWLDNSTNCSSPEYTQTLYHPEWVTAAWKWYRLPGTPAMSILPSSVSSVRSVGIEIFVNTSLPTPSTPYNIMIDDLHTTHKAYVTTKSNIKLIGAGPYTTKVRLNEKSNIPAFIMNGNGVEIAQMEIDGNFNQQQATDQSAGIYSASGSGGNIHHNFIHHIMGAGIKIRGNNFEIYENLIEWTENGQVDLAYGPSYNYIHHNTFKYAFNDDNIWIRRTNGNRVEHNDLYGIDSAALARPDKPSGVNSIGGWNGIRVDYGSYDTLIQYNRIQNIGGYSIAVANGGSPTSTYGVTVKNNRVYRGVKNCIIVQPWSTPPNISGIHIIGNFVENCQARGIDIGGSSNEISGNWTRGNQVGIYLAGSNHFGSGNYVQDGLTNTGTNNNVTQTSTAPAIPAFTGGHSW